VVLQHDLVFPAVAEVVLVPDGFAFPIGQVAQSGAAFVVQREVEIRDAGDRLQCGFNSTLNVQLSMVGEGGAEGMKMGEGVEWALHCCLNLALLDREAAVPAARLAAFHDLPTAYLNKQLQALARAEIVVSVPGRGGGFRLARDPSQITLLDVVTAIEGAQAVFRCTEVRAQGPSGSWGTAQAVCTIDAAMRKAELAWRRALAEQTLADIAATFERRYPAMPRRIGSWFNTART
jgi:Rrf2 family protein